MSVRAFTHDPLPKPGSVEPVALAPVPAVEKVRLKDITVRIGAVDLAFGLFDRTARTGRNGWSIM